MWVQIVQVSPALLGCIYRVHLVQVCSLCAILLTLARLDKIPPDALPFSPLYRFAFGALSLNMALFRVFKGFLGGFGRLCGFVLSWYFAWLVGLLCA